METELKERLDAIDEKLNSIDVCLRGNGEEGLKPRVKNLERRWSFVSKFLWVIIAAIAGVVVKLIIAP